MKPYAGGHGFDGRTDDLKWRRFNEKGKTALYLKRRHFNHTRQHRTKQRNKHTLVSGGKEETAKNRGRKRGQ